MKALQSLNKYFIKYKWHLLVGLIFIICTNYFKVMAPEIFRQGIDFLEAALELKEDKGTIPPIPESITWFDSVFGLDLTEQTVFSNSESRKSLILYYSSLLALIFGLTFVIQGIFLFFTRVSIIIMSRRIEFNMKNEIFIHYQKLSLGFFKRNSTGDLMNRISEDVSKVRMYLGPGVMYTLNLVFLVGFVLYEMISISGKLTLYTLLPLPLLSVSIYFVSSLINKKSERVQRTQSELSTFVQESTSGIRVLKAYNREKSYQENFVQLSSKYKKFVLNLVKVEALFMPLIILLVGMSTILAIYIGGKEAIDTGEISTGNIAQFILYVSMLTWPFASVGWVTSLINKAEASQERINEFLDEEPEIISGSTLKTKFSGDVSFKNVSFTYPDTGITALNDVSFKIPAGKTLGITGKTGSGKSTIVQLLSRQYDVSSGSVLIDNLDIRKCDLEGFRNSIGVVPQDVFLFSDTIENNIAFSGENFSKSDIVLAAKDADIYNNIMDFKEGMDTLLGERGLNLSGGQKQRISIARAIIKKPDFLIFDDCLSAVDTETEEKILASLNRIMANRTSVIISHRLSSIINADHIIVLDNGKIVESGTHLELLDLKGQYAELVQKQLIED